jgi:adenosylmethionine-8-amino-7-oxononanoate aminotransferase
LEFLEDRAHKRPFDPDRHIHEQVKDHALRRGLGIDPSGGTIDGRRGDHVLIAPPYIATSGDIQTIVDRLEQVVSATFDT